MNSDYKIKDINLAELGRKKISISEKEMPGLMTLREKYGSEKLKESRPCTTTLFPP
jgi:adenosylhomocysteinase